MTDFNAWLDGGSEEEKKKKNDITPNSYKQNKQFDFNAFLDTKPQPKKTVTPTVTQTPKPTAQPVQQPTQQKSFLDNLTSTIKNVLAKAIPQLAKKVEVPTSTQPTVDLTKTLKNLKQTKTKITTPLDTIDNVSQQSAQLSDQVKTSPEFIASQQKVTNIIDSVLKFNPIDTAITKTQDILAKQAEDYTTGKIKGMPPIVYSLAFYQKLTEPVLQNKYSRAFVRAESKAILGSSQKIQDLFTTKLDTPQTVGDQIAYTGIEMLTGLANLFVGGKGLEAIGVAKNAVLPTLFTILGQTGAPPSTTVQQRLAKAPVDAITGWLFNLVPGSNKLLSKETLKGMGLVAGVTAPTSFISYLVEGLPPKEAAQEALKASVINAAFHSVMVGTNIAGKKLFGESKAGTTVLTPEQAMTQATGTDLYGTKAGQDLNDIAIKAQTEGKNIQIEVVAVKQGAATKAVGVETLRKVGIEVPTISSNQGGKVVETPNGVAVRYTLVDTQAPVQKLTGETPKPKTPETKAITTQPVAPIEQKGTTPAISPATPEINKLNIKGLDKVTETKIEELNKKDIENPAPDGKIRVYQAVAPNMTTDYVFKTPEELARYKNNVTAPEENFRYIDVNPDQLNAVEGKPGVFKITQKEIPKTEQSITNQQFDIKKVGEQDGTNLVEPVAKPISDGNKVIKQIGEAIKAESYKFIGYYDEAGKPNLSYGKNYYQPDWMKEIIPIGTVIEYKTQKGDVALQTFIDDKTIGVKRIEVSTKNAGIGTTVVNNLKNLADQQQKKLVITDTIGSEKFWNKFDFLKKAEAGTFEYTPNEKKPELKTETKTYKRGDITKLETELDQLLGTENFNFTGSWQNKLAARNTAFQQLEYYSEQGDIGAKEVLQKVNDIEAKLEQARTLKKAGKISGMADIGGYSDIESMEKTLNKIKAIEFPEMLRIAKELMQGKVPVVKLPRFRPTFGGRPLGLFYSQESGKIVLNPEIFKDPNLASRVLAHEMGHLTDYLPEGNMSRGNLVGRIGTLNEFMRDLFSNPENEAKINQLIGERKPLQEQRKDLKDDKGNVKDKALDKKLLDRIKTINKQIKELQKGSIKNKVVREELIKLTQLWKPFDDQLDPDFTDYRYSAKELYADAISVLYNDPDLLKQTAPTFYKSFFENIDRKPDVRDAFFKIQELLNRGEAAVSEERDKEIDSMFQKGEDLYRVKREEYKKKQTDFLFRLKYDFIDKNQKLIDYVEKAKKAGKIIPDEDNPQYWLEEYNYLGGVLKNFAETKIQPIYEKLNKNDIEWSDFGKYLFLDRVINERGEFANPLGYAPETATKQLEYLKSQIGEEKYNTIVEQANLFRENMKSLLDPAAEAGIYDPAIVKELKLNPAYATFQVLDYLDDYIPASIKKQVGTLKEIANPADAMVLKSMSLLRAIEKNKVKTKMVDFIRKFEPGEISEAKTKFNGKVQVPVEPKELGLGLFTVMENGKVKGYYVDEYISKIFDYAGTGNNNAFLQFMGALNSKYFRPVYTTFNTGFQSFNVLRDFFRYWKNQPELNILDVLGQYKKAAPHAFNRAFGRYDEVVASMEKNKILSVTMNDLLGGVEAEAEEKQIEFALRKAGLSPSNDQRKGLFKPIFKVLDFIENCGNFVESMPKIAAYIKYQDTMSPKELGHFIRTQAGSPDFLRKGAGYYGYNNIFLFSNAIKEGFRADYEVAIKNPKTRGGWWFKTFMANMLPKLFMFAATLGAFGVGIKRMMDKVTEYDKTNYIVIPMGEDENGQAVYLRVPQDETGRFVSGLFWKMLNLGDKDQSMMKNITDVFSYMGGQAPNLNPLITVGSAMFQFGTGQNPYDWQKGRNVIPDTNFKAGGKYALIPFMKWMSDQLGGGIIYRFNVTQKAPESQTWVEKIINAPVLGNIIGRWIRVTDYGVKESLSKQEEEITAQQAARTLEKKAAIKKYVEMYRKNPNQNFLNLENELVREIYQPKGQITTAQKQGMSLLRKQFRVSVATGQNTYIDSYLYANTNESKLAILKEMRANTTDNKFKEALKSLKAQGLISSDMIIRALKK